MINLVFILKVFGVIIIAFAIYIIMQPDSRVEDEKYSKIIRVYIGENGKDSGYKDISAGSLIATMEAEECKPFDIDDIINAERVEAYAAGWMYTSFKLIKKDGERLCSSTFHK